MLAVRQRGGASVEPSAVTAAPAAGDHRATFFGQVFRTARDYNAKHDRSGVVAADALANCCPSPSTCVCQPLSTMLQLAS